WFWARAWSNGISRWIEPCGEATRRHLWSLKASPAWSKTSAQWKLVWATASKRSTTAKSQSCGSYGEWVDEVWDYADWPKGRGRESMRVLIVGLGSIGQRHVRNLRALLGDQIELLAV